MVRAWGQDFKVEHNPYSLHSPTTKPERCPQAKKKKVTSKKEKRKNHKPTNNRTTLVFVEIIFVLKGTVKFQIFAIINNYFSQFTVELVIK